MAATPRTEFAQALKAVATERGLDASVIMETMKQAIAAAWRRDRREHGEDTEGLDVDVEMDDISGETKVFAWPIDKPEERKDVTPPGFGRIAAQTAKQVIHQKIREAEKGAIMDEYNGRVGSLISGMILRFDGPNVRVDLGKTEARMPAEERIPSERLSLNQRLTFLLKRIEDGPRGKEIILSRADPQFVAKLFEREVPEISSKSVEIKAIAREAGVRSKIAVFSVQSGVDPVGSCVGQKGVRVQTVTNELGGERVDIIPWTDDISEFIKASLAPVEVSAISMNEDEKLARVVVPTDQLSLAIGKDGQNVRLVTKLLSTQKEGIWKIDIEGTEGSRKEEKEELVVEPEPEPEKEEKPKSKKTAKKEKVEEKVEEKEEVSVEGESEKTQDNE